VEKVSLEWKRKGVMDGDSSNEGNAYSQMKSTLYLKIGNAAAYSVLIFCLGAFKLVENSILQSSGNVIYVSSRICHGCSKKAAQFASGLHFITSNVSFNPLSPISYNSSMTQH